MARKSKNTNKRCPACAAIFTPKVTKCPKCGHEPLKMPNFVSERKPLKGGRKLRLKD
jgi:rRNA maturation endonuclease Nob1